jgi:hypothetical protein
MLEMFGGGRLAQDKVKLTTRPSQVNHQSIDAKDSIYTSRGTKCSEKDTNGGRKDVATAIRVKS